MKIFVETERLILREILASDDAAILELESDPEVMRYMHGEVIHTIEEARAEIALMEKQYAEDGITRWAVIEKKSGNLIGVSGFRIINELRNGHQHFYSLGYRFIRRYWGQGFATEAAVAGLRYGFETLGISDTYATVMKDNIGSRQVLTKCGLQFVNEFEHHGQDELWYRISRDQWLKHTT